MNIAQAKEEIKNTVTAYLSKDELGNYEIPAIRQRPVLLIGPPGIGKTQIMEQIAAECEIGLVAYTITHHTRQSAVGLPMISEREYDGRKVNVTEYTMSEIIASVYEAMEKTGKREGILFIDEINCVSETLTPAMLQFLQGKSFAGEPVPKGWIIVAAGNPPEYNKSVRSFDMVTMDRVRLINVEADLAVWQNYALSKSIHGAITSYLELRPANFYRVESGVDDICFVTARGWEDLSVLLRMYEKKNIPISEEIMYEYLRLEDVSEDFYAYYLLYKRYEAELDVESIVKGNAAPGTYERLIKAELDEKYASIGLIADFLSNGAESVFATGDYQGEAAIQWSGFVTSAINFLTDCFGTEGSRELMMLITALALKKESAVCLAMKPNEKYNYYSKIMLAGTKKGMLIKEIHS